MTEESEYWNRPMETMRKSELEELQWKKLKATINYSFRNSPFYKRMYSEAGVEPEDIRTVDEFRSKVPLFRKDDVRERRKETGDPFANMLTVSLDRLATVHLSTGTSGVPTFTALSAEELDVASEPSARIGWMMKIRPGMRLLCALMLDGFWHWWSTFLGVCVFGKLGVKSELIGYNFLLPVFGYPTSRIALGKFKADWIHLSPDAALATINECARMGKEPKDVLPGLTYVSCSGEAMSPSQKKMFLEKFGALDWFESWGCSDPFTLACECYIHSGLHAFSDYWLLEAVDPDTNELLPVGERGEIVSTNLWLRSLPYVRFGTEDFGKLSDEECECGRTHPTVRIYDRTSWVIEVAGKKVSPFNIRVIMEKYPETGDASFNILKYSDKMDTLKIKASYKEDITKDPDELREKIIADIKKELGVNAEIEWTPFEQLEKILHKLVRIVDLTKE
ncbi:MAG: phenylacetate--CoA ligase family protein [Candidatus Freyarchaeota archaeon]